MYASNVVRSLVINPSDATQALGQRYYGLQALHKDTRLNHKDTTDCRHFTKILRIAGTSKDIIGLQALHKILDAGTSTKIRIAGTSQKILRIAGTSKILRIAGTSQRYYGLRKDTRLQALAKILFAGTSQRYRIAGTCYGLQALRKDTRIAGTSQRYYGLQALHKILRIAGT